MAEQNYANHRRFVPLYHYVLSLILLLVLVDSIWNLWRAIGQGSDRLDAGILLMIAVALIIVFWYMRVFPLRAQDRAIRAEENLRHYVLTGNLLDPRITTRQVVGLRFASDEELPELARLAAEEGLSEDAIKRAVKTWRPDDYRV